MLSNILGVCGNGSVLGFVKAAQELPIIRYQMPGDRSRARLGEPPNLEDLEISTADEQPWDRMPVPAWPAKADFPTPQASCSSHPLADLMPDTPESDNRLAQVGICKLCGGQK